MKIYIKNMVCIRCKMVVAAELDKIGIHYKNLVLGEVDITDSFSQEQFVALDIALKKSGLELLVDKRAKLIAKIKSIIIEQIHYSEEQVKVNFTTYLSEQLNYDYNYLSNLFSEVNGTTIEHFIIHQKIERTKELIAYNDLTLSEIAWKLNYSSVQHLSNQFKKITGMNPTKFKNMTDIARISLNDVE